MTISQLKKFNFKLRYKNWYCVLDEAISSQRQYQWTYSLKRSSIYQYHFDIFQQLIFMGQLIFLPLKSIDDVIHIFL